MTTQALPQLPKQQIPPGMVLGPDGKPCKICTAFRNWKPPKSTNAATVPAIPGFAAAATSTSASTTLTPTSGEATAEASVSYSSSTRPAYCPPDVESLGRATWTFLHTTAAYYPPRADPIHQHRMRSLLSALPTLYPCSHCASHLGEMMKTSPPDVSGREGLSRWLCERHNEVNEMLGKERFDCGKVGERWRDGPADGSCD